MGIDSGRPAVPYESRDPAEIQRVSSATKGEEFVDDEREACIGNALGGVDCVGDLEPPCCSRDRDGAVCSFEVGGESIDGLAQEDRCGQ